MENAPAPDFAAITARQRATWSLGDFNAIALKVVPASEMLVEAADPRPGRRVLDVACGSGNAALIAARRSCEVIGIDYVPALIERAKQRAAADGVVAEFRVADAQALPFADGSFDVVLSCFGAMFAPDQQRTADEITRVCRPGGRIALANWMPEAYGGEFFRTMARFAPPPAGVQPPVRWGTEAALRELFGARVRDLRLERRSFLQHYRSVDDMIEEFRRFFGPTQRAFEANPGKEQAIVDAMREVVARWNRATDGTAAIASEFALATMTRAG